jgi:hypothetical protein
MASAGTVAQPTNASHRCPSADCGERRHRGPHRTWRVWSTTSRGCFSESQAGELTFVDTDTFEATF